MNDRHFSTEHAYELSRRKYVAAIGAGSAAGLAGCTGGVPFLGDEPLEFGASPASVPFAVLDETGYDEDGIHEVVIEETFEAAGQTQDVVVTNWQSQYDKSVDMGDFGLPVDDRFRGAIFTALSTPQVNVFGRTFNPIADMSSEELAGMLQDRYGGIEELEQVGEETVTILGESTPVGEYEIEAELLNGETAIDVTVHIAEAVESGDDLIVGVGGYPTAMRADERDHVMTLLEAIEH